MGRVIAWGALVALATLEGRASADVAVSALDASGRAVDMRRSNASITRTPPEREDAVDPLAKGTDPDALRFVLSGGAREVPALVSVASFDGKGRELDRQEIPAKEARCPAGLGSSCRITEPLRAVADDIDRRHPLVESRSIRAEVGGKLTLSVNGREISAIRVGGPRATPAGPIERLRGRLRLFVVRERPLGPVPFGTDEATARSLARHQVSLANALWGQCGITFGSEADVDVQVVDPPPVHLISLGCDAGLPSTGGEIRLRVDGRDLGVELRPGLTPRAAARLVARALERGGFSARVSENARVEPGADRTADVLLRRKDGRYASLERPSDGRLTTDRTMTVCLGGVDLTDGLDHFVDLDAPAGTVEERALVKAFDDGDPSWIKVFMIPAFAGGGRIGESFIFADSSSVRNVVIQDRAAIRADRASFALAHELGHILLDMPGHPDDYGADRPTLLMDSDAADPSAFGPRRITLAECARAYRQSGPQAPVPLLTTWRLPPL